jgi:hypothetical protein
MATNALVDAGGRGNLRHARTARFLGADPDHVGWDDVSVRPRLMEVLC